MSGRTTNSLRQTSVFSLIGALTLAAVGTGTPTSGAAPPDGPPDPPQFSEGAWTGIITVDGTGVAVEAEGTITWSVDLGGDAAFTSADGVVSGDARLRGDWTLDLEGPESSANGIFVAEGGGPVSGPATAPILDTRLDSTGSLIVSAEGRSIELPVADNPGVAVPIEAAVIHAGCDDVLAEFSVPLEELAAEYGFAASAEGRLVAVRDTEAASAAVEELLAGLRIGTDVDADLPPLLQAIAAIETRYNAWAMMINGSDPLPANAWNTTEQLWSDIGDVFTALRNASPCTLSFLGEGQVAQFDTFLTRAVAGMIARIAERFDNVGILRLRALGEAAFNVGAIGPGGRDPGAAREAREGLTSIAQDILEPYVVEGSEGCPCLERSRESLSALHMMGQLGYQLEVGGTTVDAAAVASEMWSVNDGEVVSL